MKNQALKNIILFLCAALAEGVIMTLLTLFCTLVLATRSGDLAGTVRGFGLILIVLAEDSLSARICRGWRFPTLCRLALDAAALIAGLAISYVFLTYTPLSGLFK